MKTKKYFNILIATLGIAFTSCEDMLVFEKPGKIQAPDAFLTPQDAVNAVIAAYSCLEWEYNSGYIPEWWIGDVCSDDALKGGSYISDMEDVYDLENFKTLSDNGILRTFYCSQYVGAYRANLVLEYVSAMDTLLFAGNMSVRTTVLAEAHFLRSLFHLRLVRVYGGVPLADRVIYVQSEWRQPRASEADTYKMIYDDLKLAIEDLPESYPAAELGRATKGAARALLMKVYLLNHEYDKAKEQGELIYNSGIYSLVDNYNDLFTIEGENGKESVFETQYMTVGNSDWGEGGRSRGNFTTLITRPNWAVPRGYGFNRPSQELYDEYEAGDPRREATIYTPTIAQIGAPYDDNTNNVNVYLGNAYTSRKYSLMLPDSSFLNPGHDTRSPINRKDIRYADVLLMYAEACVNASASDINRAKQLLEAVRNRARITAGRNDILPAFPNYSVNLRLVGETGNRQLQDTPADLLLAIQHERRVELGMEGHRWFDLKRWGLLDKVMNHYQETTKPKIAEHIAPFIKGKHELFPIPLQERDLNPMSQNPGYDGVPVN